VEASGIKKRDRSHDDSSCSDLERIRESMEKLKIQTLTTYNQMKQEQAPISQMKKVQEAFVALNSLDNPMIISTSLHLEEAKEKSGGFLPPPPPPPPKFTG